jgi:hypothetical protein
VAGGLNKRTGHRDKLLYESVMARDHARPTRRERNGVLYELVELRKWPQQDLVDRDALGRRDRVDDQRRDVLDGEDLGSARYSASVSCRVSRCEMCSGSSVATAPGSTQITRTSCSSSSCRSASDHSDGVLGRRVDVGSGVRLAPRDRGEVDDVAAVDAEVVDEDVCRIEHAEQVRLHHSPPLVARPARNGEFSITPALLTRQSTRPKRARIRTAARRSGVQVADVGPDREGRLAELRRGRLHPLPPPRE